MHWKILIATLAITLAATFGFACSDDNSSDDNGGGQPEATEQTPDDGVTPNGSEEPVSGGSGSATLTIGDESWTFTDLFCGFSPEETRNDRVSFTLSAFGESATGARTQLDATIQDTEEQGRYEGDGTIHSVSLNDIEDFDNPSVAWDAVTGIVGGGAFTINVNGKNVSAEAVFDDGRTNDVLEEVAGTLEAVCP